MPWDPQRARAVALRVGATALGLYTLAVLAVCTLQEKLLFQPEVLPADHRFGFGADVHEVAIDVPGARLSALHLRNAAPSGVVFYLHGNASSLEGWFADVDVYRRANYDLFMVDFRGYGKSTGTIENEAQLRADVRAAWDTIAGQYAGQRRIIVGRSLGTALAAGLAVDVDPDLTVLISPLRSMNAMGERLFPWVPDALLRALLRYPLRTEDDVPRIRGPLLVLHGERDELIPIEHAEALVASKPGAELVRIPDAGHNDISQHQAYAEAFGAALVGG